MHNPIIEFNKDTMLYPGEQIAPLNPCTNQGYIILPYYYVTTYGRYFSTAKGRFEERILQVDTSNYLQLKVVTTAGEKHILAHRGVMSTFCPVPNMYALEVDHKNGNHYDNHITNLVWATSSQNNLSARLNNITPARSRDISDDDIRVIMRLAEDGFTDEEISNRFPSHKIAPETIRFIRTGQSIYGDVLKKLGISPILKKEHKFLTQDDYDRVLDLSNQGMSSGQISEVTGIPSRTVRGIIQRSVTTPKVKMKNPIREVSKEYANLEMVPVNMYTSPLHVISPYYMITKSGRIFSTANNNLTEMKIYENNKGNAVIGLRTNNGNKQFFVQRLVLSTFNPVPNMYDLEVHHKDGNHMNCALDNLEWSTHEETMRKVANNITNRIPQRAPDEDVIRVIELANEGKTDEEIAALMDNKYTPHNVMIIRRGLKTYGAVLEKLNLEPYRHQAVAVPPEKRAEIYQYIKDRLGEKGLMDLYQDAGAKFGLAPDSVRRIYSQEKSK